MHGKERPKPPQDATIIGSELEQYLRASSGEFAPPSEAEFDPPSEAEFDPPSEQEPTPPIAFGLPVSSGWPQPDVRAAYLAADKHPNLAAKAYAFSSTGIFLSDRQYRLILMCNGSFLSMTGYQYKSVVGAPPDQFTPGLGAEALHEVRTQLDQSGSWDGNVWIRRQDGSEFPAQLAVRAVRDGDGSVTGHVTSVADMSAIRQAENLLREQIQKDPLTGLVNRAVLQDRLEWALAECKRSGSRAAVLCLDLDRFKYINDSLGHAVGDKLLRQVGHRLSALVRAEDTVARIGGNEFVVLLPDIADAHAAAELGVKLGHELHHPYQIGGETLTITTSIGISLFPEDGGDGNTLLQHADTAMYRAKGGGRNRYVFYQAEMTEHVSARFAMQKDLALALQRDEFVLHYQPQIDISSGRIVGAEALIRWQHPELGLLPPDHFIPAAEESGLIRTIGEWVIRKVGSEMLEWRKMALPRLRIAMNLSALQIARPQHTDALCAVVIAAGMAHAESGTDIEIEITESSLMTGEHALAAVSALKGLGLTLAIDDFGTGYSSMMALKQLPIDCLKIDRSFIKNLPDDANDAAMTAAVIAMGKALGLRLLAEGVETNAQLAFLRAHGCHEAQGFLFSEALPIAAFREFVVSAGTAPYAPPEA